MAQISAELNSETLEFSLKTSEEELKLLEGKGLLSSYPNGLKVKIDPRRKP